MSCVEDAQSPLLELPLDVLYYILSHCDSHTLGRLSTVCRRFHGIVNDDYIWRKRSKDVLATNQLDEGIRKRSFCMLTPKEKCRISVNWKKGYTNREAVILHRTCYMPWLKLESRCLWYSKGTVIQCYFRKRDGRIGPIPNRTLKGHLDDVCRFVCKENLVVSGGRDASICGWNAETGQFLFCKRKCHNGDINSVDIWRNTIVSVSRDMTLKFWNLQNYCATLQKSILIKDRIWSVAIPPGGRHVLTGSAGYHNISPLQMFDLEKSVHICDLGNGYRNGAGVLDIHCETQNEILSCGYDTCTRLWDMRCPNECVLQWEDPHDSTVYCVTSDNKMTIVTGTARHGLVRLWDKRMTKCIFMFYVGKENSPAYSVDFDPCQMYVALDRSLNILSFTGQYAPKHMSYG